jgi:MATE family multidrug resistance protein
VLTNLLSHWALGLPLGYLLCFGQGWGISGLWLGLYLGLTIVAMVLTLVWISRARALQLGPLTL